MRRVLRHLAGGAVVVAALANVAGAGERLTNALKVEQAVRANLMPFSPAYVAPKCLVPYPLCKFAFAGVSLITSWEQLLMGGDLEGAQAALARGFEGSWFVRPANVSGEALWSAPPPVPLVGYFVTGRSNAGDEAIEPLQSTKPAATDGDILPP